MKKLDENQSGWLIGGGAAAGLVASLCCIGPLILTVLGVSGAAVLAKVEVVRIPLIIVVLALFGYAGYTLFRKRKSCEPGSICADPKRFRLMTIAYFVGLAIALLGILSPYWVVWIFD